MSEGLRHDASPRGVSYVCLSRPRYRHFVLKAFTEISRPSTSWMMPRPNAWKVVTRHSSSSGSTFDCLAMRSLSSLAAHGIAVAGLWAEHFNIRWVVGAMQGLSARLNTMISFWIVVLIYVLLGLLEVGPLARRIPSIVGSEAARVLIVGGERTAAKLRRYLLIRTIMSVATGGTVYVFALALGLQLATEWGVIAFTLNFVPFVGPFIATLLPTFYALAQFESLYSALFVFACLNLIQFAIGSYIEPRVAGKALALSPFLVLFSVFLWMFLWDLFGAFIGVPIAIAVLTFCAQSQSARWLAQLLGASDDVDSAQNLLG